MSEAIVAASANINYFWVLNCCIIQYIRLTIIRRQCCFRVQMAFKYIWCYRIFLWCYVCGNSEDVTKHPGHLKPFASHGKILNVESLNYFPDPRVFFPNYVHGSKPLHIRGGAKISPAYSLWSDEYFLTFKEGKEVTVIVEQAKKENRTLPAEEIPFTEFVKRYRNEDIYLVNDLPDFLRYIEKWFLVPHPCTS